MKEENSFSMMMYALLHPFSADGADPGQAGDVRRRRQHHQHHLRRRERPGQRPVDAQGEGTQSDKMSCRGGSVRSMIVFLGCLNTPVELPKIVNPLLHLIPHLVNLYWQFYSMGPQHRTLSVVLMRGFSNTACRRRSEVFAAVPTSLSSLGLIRRAAAFHSFLRSPFFPFPYSLFLRGL